MRCDTLGISRRSSLNRLGPCASVCTTSTVHLSPIRDSRVLIVRHTGLLGSFMVGSPAPFGYAAVPAPQICSCLTKKCVLASDWMVVIWGASVTIPYQGGNSDHSPYRRQHQR